MNPEYYSAKIKKEVLFYYGLFLIDKAILCLKKYHEMLGTFIYTVLTQKLLVPNFFHCSF